MNLLDCLEALNATLPASGTLTEAHYARLPFHLLGNGQSPFDQWRRPESQVPAGLEDLWKQSAASYQLCTFHAVNAVTRGSAFAERVLAFQIRFLDELRGGLGAQHEAEIRKLYAFAKDPLQITGPDGGLLEIPSEWRAAVDFLLTSAHSPFKSDEEAFSMEGAPSFPDDLDVALALNLEHAWDAASACFGELLQAVE